MSTFSDNPETKEQTELKAFYDWITEGVKPIPKAMDLIISPRKNKEYAEEDYKSKLQDFQRLIDAQSDENVEFIGQAVVSSEAVDCITKQRLDILAKSGRLGRAIICGGNSEWGAAINSRIGDGSVLYNTTLAGSVEIYNSTLQNVVAKDGVTVQNSNLWDTELLENVRVLNSEGSTRSSWEGTALAAGAFSNCSIGVTSDGQIITTPRFPDQ